MLNIKKEKYFSDIDSLKKKLSNRTKVDKKTKCWNYIGATNSYGYGKVQYKLKRYLAHRLSYFFYKGRIPVSKFVCHKCDNRLCINPKHLWLGDANDNNKDREKKSRGHRIKINKDIDKRIKNEHKKLYEKGLKKYGDKSSNHKLTEKDVIKIRKMDGTYEDISKIYNVHPNTISCIARRKTWKHI